MTRKTKVLLIATVTELLAVAGILMAVEPTKTWLMVNLKALAKWAITPRW